LFPFAKKKKLKIDLALRGSREGRKSGFKGSWPIETCAKITLMEVER
jgi:hypothetical protein